MLEMLVTHKRSPPLCVQFKVISSNVGAKSVEVYMVITITFDHPTGVQLMCCNVQLVAGCLQVPW